DGKVIATGLTSTHRFFCSPGSHPFEVIVGTATRKETFEGKAGEKRVIRLAVNEESPKAALWPVVMAGGVALGGLGLAIGGAVAAASKGTQATTQREAVLKGGVACPGAAGCSELKQTLYDQRTMETAAAIGFIMAGTALVAGT